MSKRPVIGIICCTRTVGVEPAQAVMSRYVSAAMRYADAAALLVPALPEQMGAEDVADRLDGILLTGSPSNVEPARYERGGNGQQGQHDPGEGPFDRSRDSMAFGLIDAMIARGRPVFGICRGFQEINAALGGTLRRDVARNPHLIRHHAPDGVSFAAMFDHGHPVALTPGGALAQALGKAELVVNSVHYQGVAELAPRLTIEARAPDGLVEAYSGRIGATQILGVQWHPEWQTETDADSQAFFALLGRAVRGDTVVPDGHTDPQVRVETK